MAAYAFSRMRFAGRVTILERHSADPGLSELAGTCRHLRVDLPVGEDYPSAGIEYTRRLDHGLPGWIDGHQYLADERIFGHDPPRHRRIRHGGWGQPFPDLLSSAPPAPSSNPGGDRI